MGPSVHLTLDLARRTGLSPQKLSRSPIQGAPLQEHEALPQVNSATPPNEAIITYHLHQRDRIGLPRDWMKYELKTPTVQDRCDRLSTFSLIRVQSHRVPPARSQTWRYPCNVWPVVFRILSDFPPGIYMSWNLPLDPGGETCSENHSWSVTKSAC